MYEQNHVMNLCHVLYDYVVYIYDVLTYIIIIYTNIYIFRKKIYSEIRKRIHKSAVYK